LQAINIPLLGFVIVRLCTYLCLIYTNSTLDVVALRFSK